ncbi:uncharacterized protein MONOS_14556 [Monocercomonoides exilis]|uniref:uncharacterized protein n=1 Tax=Monocercomonoides exilis TaxID=2049356 RepID=UPI00355AC9CC|nr:hypothetical protein MONOS_14556 [Monocercomonoides exilis]|eukprot:MONOS_14556.1-p1 / transcript=MONOS_14556.1 / gene=MONOS_14556 / organism=Monocercomonoides_exilis_PA203 / gene_product=unspecified product / transcript_product=unspecified product / location=Mono_scaffold01024:4930-11760(-) / protein_length=1925 / sequence_SO=supercontig / SO=protein_coding / is_pseudo=false
MAHLRGLYPQHGGKKKHLLQIWVNQHIIISDQKEIEEMDEEVQDADDILGVNEERKEEDDELSAGDEEKMEPKQILEAFEIAAINFQSTNSSDAEKVLIDAAKCPVSITLFLAENVKTPDAKFHSANAFKTSLFREWKSITWPEKVLMRKKFIDLACDASNQFHLRTKYLSISVLITKRGWFDEVPSVAKASNLATNQENASFFAQILDFCENSDPMKQYIGISLFEMIVSEFSTPSSELGLPIDFHDHCRQSFQSQMLLPILRHSFKAIDQFFSFISSGTNESSGQSAKTLSPAHLLNSLSKEKVLLLQKNIELCNQILNWDFSSMGCETNKEDNQKSENERSKSTASSLCNIKVNPFPAEWGSEITAQRVQMIFSLYSLIHSHPTLGKPTLQLITALSQVSASSPAFPLSVAASASSQASSLICYPPSSSPLVHTLSMQNPLSVCSKDFGVALFDGCTKMLDFLIAQIKQIVQAATPSSHLSEDSISFLEELNESFCSLSFVMCTLVLNFKLRVMLFIPPSAAVWDKMLLFTAYSLQPSYPLQETWEMETFDCYLEAWNAITSDPLYCNELDEYTLQIFDSYVALRPFINSSSSPDSSNPTNSTVFDASSSSLSYPLSSSDEDQLLLIASLGRLTPFRTLSVLAERLKHLLSEWKNAVSGQSNISAQASALQSVAQQLRWAVHAVGWVIADNEEGETPLIPGAIMSILPSFDQSLSSPFATQPQMTPGGGSGGGGGGLLPLPSTGMGAPSPEPMTDIVQVCMDGVLACLGYAVALIEQSQEQSVSQIEGASDLLRMFLPPQLLGALFCCIGRWMHSYVMIDTSLYSSLAGTFPQQISVLASRYSPSSPSSISLLSSLLRSVLLSLSTFSTDDRFVSSVLAVLSLVSSHPLLRWAVVHHCGDGWWGWAKATLRAGLSNKQLEFDLSEHSKDSLFSLPATNLSQSLAAGASAMTPQSMRYESIFHSISLENKSQLISIFIPSTLGLGETPNSAEKEWAAAAQLANAKLTSGAGGIGSISATTGTPLEELLKATDESGMMQTSSSSFLPSSTNSQQFLSSSQTSLNSLSAVFNMLSELVMPIAVRVHSLFTFASLPDLTQLIYASLTHHRNLTSKQLNCPALLTPGPISFLPPSQPSNSQSASSSASSSASASASPQQLMQSQTQPQPPAITSFPVNSLLLSSLLDSLLCNASDPSQFLSSLDEHLTGCCSCRFSPPSGGSSCCLFHPAVMQQQLQQLQLQSSSQSAAAHMALTLAVVQMLCLSVGAQTSTGMNHRMALRVSLAVLKGAAAACNQPILQAILTRMLAPLFAPFLCLVGSCPVIPSIYSPTSQLFKNCCSSSSSPSPSSSTPSSSSCFAFDICTLIEKLSLLPVPPTLYSSLQTQNLQPDSAPSLSDLPYPVFMKLLSDILQPNANLSALYSGGTGAAVPSAELLNDVVQHLRSVAGSPQFVPPTARLSLCPVGGASGALIRIGGAESSVSSSPFLLPLVQWIPFVAPIQSLPQDKDLLAECVSTLGLFVTAHHTFHSKHDRLIVTRFGTQLIKTWSNLIYSLNASIDSAKQQASSTSSAASGLAAPYSSLGASQLQQLQKNAEPITSQVEDILSLVEFQLQRKESSSILSENGILPAECFTLSSYSSPPVPSLVTQILSEHKALQIANAPSSLAGLVSCTPLFSNIPNLSSLVHSPLTFSTRVSLTLLTYTLPLLNTFNTQIVSLLQRAVRLIHSFVSSPEYGIHFSDLSLHAQRHALRLLSDASSSPDFISAAIALDTTKTLALLLVPLRALPPPSTPRKAQRHQLAIATASEMVPLQGSILRILFVGDREVDTIIHPGSNCVCALSALCVEETERLLQQVVSQIITEQQKMGELNQSASNSIPSSSSVTQMVGAFWSAAKVQCVHPLTEDKFEWFRTHFPTVVKAVRGQAKIR